MGGFFSRNASPRQIATIWLVFGMAWGIQTRGSWTEDWDLMRFGAYALAAGGLLLLGALAALPMRCIPGMWQDERTSFFVYAAAIGAGLGAGFSLSLLGLWFSPWGPVATAATMLTVTAAVVAFLFVSARRVA